MIDVKTFYLCKPNPITGSATLYFDPEEETGLCVVQFQHIWNGGSAHLSNFRPLESKYAHEIFEILNDGEHDDIIKRFFRKKDENGLYPICKVNILTHALGVGRQPLDMMERFHKNGYFADGKIGG